MIELYIILITVSVPVACLSIVKYILNQLLCMFFRDCANEDVACIILNASYLIFSCLSTISCSCIIHRIWLTLNESWN